MEAERLDRFSSCRGVSFEMKPDHHLSDPFSKNNPTSRSQRYWPSSWRGGSSRISHAAVIGDLLQNSPSRPSSHFCDLDLDDYDIESGPELGKVDPVPLPPSTAKNGQKSRAGQDSNYSRRRLSVILFDQGLFTVYKRLFVTSLALNLTGLVLAATGHFPYAKKKAPLFSIANIFALTLCRSEAFLRVLFWIAVKILGHSWVPMRIKTMATSLLQSLGGIHSACGISSFIWLSYALYLRENASPGIVAVSSTILSLICLSCLSAFPLVRHLHHNVFERTHRFAGWSALALLWAFIFLTVSYDPETKSYHHHRTIITTKLITRQEFWFTVAVTVLIIIPWITVRRVPVKISSSPSGHASIIEFRGGVKPGLLGRISPSPLSEWHAFGIISDGKEEHVMLAGAVGDFTKSLVLNPPSHLWVRGLHFAGLPYLVNMYDRVLVVATGSGICVFLSFLLQPCSSDVRFLWVTKGVEQNFGKRINGWVGGHPKDKVIVHDTGLMGRPNVAQMSVDAAQKWGSQVVIVTSNPEGSRDVVNSCKAAGIPAFGPIWDS